MNKPLYFSHDCEAKNDIKIIELRSKHGWSSYGIFWALIEDLCKMPNYEIEKSKLSLLAFTYNLELSYLELIYNDCLELELLSEKNNKFFSKSLKSRMEKLDKKRKNQSEGGKIGMANRYKNQQDNNTKLLITNLDENSNIDITVKESIVKDSKVKDSKIIIKEYDKNDESKEAKFSRLWNFYDKKIDLQKSWNAFKKLNSEELELMRQNLKEYIKSTPDKEYRKNLATYINQKSWNNEIITPKVKNEEPNPYR